MNTELMNRLSAIYDELDAITTDPDYALWEVLVGLRNLAHDVAASAERLAQS